MKGFGFGCKITKPPPAGYKCSCGRSTKSQFILTCDGTVVECNSHEDPGCHGCKDKECCLGNCDGYQFKYINELENVQTPMFGG